MSIALIMVEKTLGGKRWVNTHAVQVGAASTGIPSDADLATMGAGVPLTATNTTTTPTNFIQRLVAFERLVHIQDAAITKVYITDGKKKSANAAATVYAILTCNLSGQNPAYAGGPAGAALEPGAITLMLHRSAAGFSHKPGRLYYRAALGEGMVKIGGVRLIDWETDTQRQNVTSNIAAAVSGSGLATHFVGGANAAQALYALAHYNVSTAPPGPLNTNGELSTVFGITAIDVVGPVIRQVQRGRKKKAAATTTVA